jgi:hypothetical protein
MIFETYMAFSLTLLALVAGTVLLGSVDKLSPCCKIPAKMAGFLTVGLSIVQLLCASYNTVKYWEDGVYKRSEACSMKSGDAGDKMMMNQMMMKPMMGDGMGPQGMSPGKGPNNPGQMPPEPKRDSGNHE